MEALLAIIPLGWEEIPSMDFLSISPSQPRHPWFSQMMMTLSPYQAWGPPYPLCLRLSNMEPMQRRHLGSMDP